MKKLIATLCTALACSFLFTATPVQAKSANYEITQTKNYQMIWSNGTNKIYLKSNKDYTKQNLYLKNIKSGKAKLLKTFKLDMDEDTGYSIGNVYGSKIYLNLVRGAGDGDLYTYNLKSGKFTRVRKNFVILNASGKYLIAANYQPTDISPFPSYIYKITSKGFQKIKKLGQNTAQAQFVGNKVYYAKFPNDGSINEMSVCSCGVTGKNTKVVFRVKSQDEQGYVMLQNVDKNAIVYVDVPVNKDPVYYRFDMKTEKTTQIPEAEVQQMLGI